MSKIFDLILNRSNSYKYYKSQNEILEDKIENTNLKYSKLNNEYKKMIKEDIALRKQLDLFKKDFISITDSINQGIIRNQQENARNHQENIRNHQKNMKLYQELIFSLKELKKQTDFVKIQNNLQSIKNKVGNNELINIVFIMHFPNNIMDLLYNLLEKDELFNPIILLIPNDSFSLNICKKGLNKFEMNEYEDNFNYFKNKGFNVIKAYDNDTKSLLDMELEIKPHIIFYSSPYEGPIPSEYKIKNLSNDILFCYIPYGIYIAKLQEYQFNQELHRKAWKIFCETPIHKELAAKYSDIGSSNVVMTGYPKMDPLIDGSYKQMPKIWKNDNNSKVKIIWAPHHSIGSSTTAFSTFDKNYKFFYSFAKEHTEIQWIFKPHFQLKYADFHMSETEDFSAKNLKKYYNKWNELDNASVYEGGDYLNMFLNSDAMITDSVSFLAEYLYVNKPGLFLTRKKQEFNEFGELIITAWYKVRGDDFKGIENFINEIVIQENDYLKSSRKNIYDNYLNTDSIASLNIYNYIKEKLR